MTKPTSTAPRLKPLVRRVKLIHGGLPEVLLGDITIDPEYVEDDRFWASGLVMREGKPIGLRISINGAPISLFPFESTSPPGRPRADAKRVAVWLEWNINLMRTRQALQADDRTAAWFGYKRNQTVLEIRNTHIKKIIPALPERLIVIGNDNLRDGCAAYIEKPTHSLRDGRLEIKGTGWTWCESLGAQEAEHGPIEVSGTLENPDMSVWDEFVTKDTPILLIAFGDWR